MLASAAEECWLIGTRTPTARQLHCLSMKNILAGPNVDKLFHVESTLPSLRTAEFSAEIRVNAHSIRTFCTFITGTFQLGSLRRDFWRR
jgi:hypothetical protein